MTLVDRAAAFLETRLSRRNLFTRSALVGSALTVDPLDYLLHPTPALNLLCTCGDYACGCGSTCCSGFTQFCCTINGGYNWCPDGNVLGGWWKADSSVFCAGPRYYLDCNASCGCTAGCGNGWNFCDPGCDGLTCGCALGDCNLYMTGCLQFRYGQCNQQVACLGRILCRVVSCIPPWQIDPTCTSVSATDEGTAVQNAPCTTPVPAPPFPVPVVTVGPQSATVVVGSTVTFTAAATNATAVQWQWSADGGATWSDAPSQSDALTVVAEVALDGLEVRAVFTDGTQPTPAVTAPATLTVRWVPGATSTPSGAGYWLVGDDGGVFPFGSALDAGSLAGDPLNTMVVGIAHTPSGNGYWLAAADGGIFAFGDAGFAGSMGGSPLNAPIVGAAATPSGDGYWLVAADGGIFAFGDAGFHGSMGGSPLNQPIVGMATTPSGNGYWLVAADGGIFSFGDAGFHGSMGGSPLNQPIVGMAATPSGDGYWLVAADGGIFAFGDAGFRGSLGALHLDVPISAIVAVPAQRVREAGQGYWLVGQDGGVFSFGSAQYYGSLPGEQVLP